MPLFIILGLLLVFGVALMMLKELCSRIARFLLKIMGGIAKWIFGTAFKIVSAPFHILWGLFLDR